MRTDLRGAIEGLGVTLRSEMVGLRDELRGEMVDMRDLLRSEMVDMRDEMRRHFGVVAERFDQDIATTAEVVAAHGEQMARLRIDLTREIDSRIKASAAVTRAGFRVLQRQIDSLRAQD
jgi:hypothetical protein